MNVFLEVLQRTVAYVAQSQEPAEQKNQRDQTDHFPLCIIRLGESES